eukprot:gene22463-27109_t
MGGTDRRAGLRGTDLRAGRSLRVKDGENVAQGISLWLWRDSQQPELGQATHFLVDGRYGSPEAYLSSGAVGTAWGSLFIDGNRLEQLGPNLEGAWENIPDDVWCHVHLETIEPFTDDLNLMSETAGGATDHSSIEQHGSLKDSGQRWEAQPQCTNVELRAVVFRDELREGFLVGEGGATCYSNNHGVTWREQMENTDGSLYALGHLEGMTGGISTMSFGQYGQ